MKSEFLTDFLKERLVQLKNVGAEKRKQRLLLFPSGTVSSHTAVQRNVRICYEFI